MATCRTYLPNVKDDRGQASDFAKPNTRASGLRSIVLLGGTSIWNHRELPERGRMSPVHVLMGPKTEPRTRSPEWAALKNDTFVSILKNNTYTKDNPFKYYYWLIDPGQGR